MRQEVHFITVSTPDLDAVRAFYVNGLGWTSLLDVPDEIVFFQVAPGVVLGFFEAVKFRKDLKTDVATSGPSGITLAHNADTEAEVDEILTRAQTAGGRLVKAGQRADFGGYHGHIADPTGLIWEISYNPGWRLDGDGTVHLVEIDPAAPEDT